MKPVTIFTKGKLIRGILNIKANLVSYVDSQGHAQYEPASAIVPVFLTKQAF